MAIFILHHFHHVDDRILYLVKGVRVGANRYIFSRDPVNLLGDMKLQTA